MMKSLNAYIADTDELVLDILEHLLTEAIEEHCLNSKKQQIHKINKDTSFESGPKLFILSEDLYPLNKLEDFLTQNFKQEEDYVIVMGEPKEYQTISQNYQEDRFWVIPTPIDATKFITILDDIFTSKDSEDRDYHKVSFELLPNIGDTLNAELFIKIGDDKFVNILHSGAKLEEKFIDQYQEKAKNNLYIKRSDAKAFYSTKISQALARSGTIILQSNPEDMQMGDLSKELGVSEDTVEMVDKITGSIMSELKSNRSFKDLLSHISDDENFSSNLSQLTSYIVVQLAAKSKYGNQSLFKKLVFASIFCDLLLNDEKLVMIKDMQDTSIGVLSSRQRQELLKHGPLAAEVIANAQNFSTDEIAIVEQHHERPNGKGFPKGLVASQIAKNAAIFITAQEVAYYVLRDYESGKIKIKSYFEEMIFDEFQSGNFSEFFKLLAEITGFED